MNATLPALEPVEVPWQISASAASLRVEPRKVGIEQPIHVDFIGFFGAASRYHHVHLVFDPCCALRVLPSISASQVINDSAYDWSNVPGRMLPGETVDHSLQRIRTSWMRTGVCPNPRMYEVSPSPWMNELNLPAATGWKHYLLAGSDEYIEILARKWAWTLGRPAS